VIKVVGKFWKSSCRFFYIRKVMRVIQTCPRFNHFLSWRWKWKFKPLIWNSSISLLYRI